MGALPSACKPASDEVECYISSKYRRHERIRGLSRDQLRATACLHECSTTARHALGLDACACTQPLRSEADSFMMQTTKGHGSAAVHVRREVSALVQESMKRAAVLSGLLKVVCGLIVLELLLGDSVLANIRTDSHLLCGCAYSRIAGLEEVWGRCSQR